MWAFGLGGGRAEKAGWSGEPRASTIAYRNGGHARCPGRPFTSTMGVPSGSYCVRQRHVSPRASPPSPGWRRRRPAPARVAAGQLVHPLGRERAAAPRTARPSGSARRDRFSRQICTRGARHRTGIARRDADRRVARAVERVEARLQAEAAGRQGLLQLLPEPGGARAQWLQRTSVNSVKRTGASAGPRSARGPGSVSAGPRRMRPSASASACRAGGRELSPRSRAAPRPTVRIGRRGRRDGARGRRRPR